MPEKSIFRGFLQEPPVMTFCYSFVLITFLEPKQCSLHSKTSCQKHIWDHHKSYKKTSNYLHLVVHILEKATGRLKIEIKKCHCQGTPDPLAVTFKPLKQRVMSSTIYKVDKHFTFSSNPSPIITETETETEAET